MTNLWKLFFSIIFILFFFLVCTAEAKISSPLLQSVIKTMSDKGTDTNSQKKIPIKANKCAEETPVQRIPRPERNDLYSNRSKRKNARRSKKRKHSSKTFASKKDKESLDTDKTKGVKQSKLKQEITPPASRNKELSQDVNSEYMAKMIELLPSKVNPVYQISSKDFTRNSVLTLPKTIVFVLSAVASGKAKGIDNKSGEFFKNARRSGLWPNAEAVHRSAVTKARKKVDWKYFRDIFNNSVKLAYETWPDDSCFTWHGMSVFAFDGSTYVLPATQAIREKFDPESGLEYPGRGHYPECLVSTAYDVFRRIPVGRTIVGKKQACERTQAKEMIPHIPPNNIMLFDRGYPSYDLFYYSNTNYSGYYIFRCPAKNSFLAIDKFIESKKKESIISINPSNSFFKSLSKKDRKKAVPIKLRVIKMTDKDGKASVLLTNLFDKDKFSKKEMIDLYFRRWEVENHYRDEKIYLEIEKFHSKSCNGIKQELFAILAMTVISKTLMILNSFGKIESQFKNSIMALASDAALLAPEKPEIALKIFKEVITEIKRVKYNRAKKPRASQPRVTKRAENKWTKNKIQKSKSP